jgi:hypothetical protein
MKKRQTGYLFFVSARTNKRHNHLHDLNCKTEWLLLVITAVPNTKLSAWGEEVIHDLN